jgi:hypothetical protein
MADAQDGRYTHTHAHTHTHIHTYTYVYTYIIVQVPSEYRLWIISKMNKGEGRPRFTFWLQRKDDHKALQWYKGELRGGPRGKKQKNKKSIE